MSNLDNIISKLTENAKEEAAKIAEKSKNTCSEIISKKVEEATSIKTQILNEANKDAERILERAESDARLKSRDKVLKAKEEVLDRVFDKTKELLRDLDDEKYLEFFKKIINEVEPEKDAEIILQKGRLELIKKDFSNLNINEEKYLNSGFIIKEENRIYNYNFDEMVDYQRTDFESELAKELFG
ncbi:MAG: V-type ATP synthase subunit E [Tissierellia bacterium]|nr:V-type ATP synthase subunit E [Tissierellia bacterium]